MDLFVNDVNDISSGNMRKRANEQANAAIGIHNQQIARNITQIHKDLQNFQSQASEQEALGAVAGGVEGLLGANSLGSALQEFKEQRAAGIAKKNALANLKSQAPLGAEGDIRVGVEDNDRPSVETPENSTPSPAESATPEGTSATPSSNTAPTTAEHESITVGEDATGKSGSMIHDGIKNITGLSDESIDRIGKVGGVLSAGATGGIDLYKDVKSGGIAGANGFEKAGNVLQIGGAISDIAGAVPFLQPLEVVGGILDVLGGGLDAIGEAVEGQTSKSEEEESTQKATEAQEAMKQQVSVIGGQAPTALARVQ